MNKCEEIEPPHRIELALFEAEAERTRERYLGSLRDLAWHTVSASAPGHVIAMRAEINELERGLDAVRDILAGHTAPGRKRKAD